MKGLIRLGSVRIFGELTVVAFVLLVSHLTMAAPAKYTVDEDAGIGEPTHQYTPASFDNCTWYRFTFRQGSAMANDPYVSLYEFGLFDADGNNQFTGTRENTEKTANPGSLSTGEMCWDVTGVVSGDNNKNGLNLLSDGKKVKASGSNWPFMYVRSSTKPAIGTPASWTSFTLRLADGASLVTSYDMCANKAGKTDAQRSLRGWKLEGSVDGETFVGLDEKQDQVAQVEGAWFKDGSEFVEGGTHTTGYPIDSRVPSDDGEIVLAGDEDSVGVIKDTSGELSVVKNGGGTWVLRGAQEMTGGLNVNEGTITLDLPGVAYTWYRFTFRQGASDQAYDKYTSSIFEFSLFDAQGNSQSVGVKENADKTAEPGTLDPGEMCWDVSDVNCQDGKNPLNLLTDGTKALGKSSSWPFMFVRNGTWPNINKPETWTSFTMRLADGSNPITSYDMCANKAGENAQRRLQGWKLEGSVDGETYVELDAKQDQVAPVEGAWFRDGTEFVEGGAHTTGYPIDSGKSASAEAVLSFMTNVQSIAIAKGAKFAAGCKTTLPLLRLKPLVENGTISAFSFAETGTIELVDVPKEETIAYSLENCTDVENLRNWNVKVNGVESDWRVRVKDGVLKIYPRFGLIILVQ